MSTLPMSLPGKVDSGGSTHSCSYGRAVDYPSHGILLCSTSNKISLTDILVSDTSLIQSNPTTQNNKTIICQIGQQTNPSTETRLCCSCVLPRAMDVARFNSLAVSFSISLASKYRPPVWFALAGADA